MFALAVRMDTVGRHRLPHFYTQLLDLANYSKILAVAIDKHFAVTPYHPDWNSFCAVDLDRFELDAPIEDLHLVSSTTRQHRFITGNSWVEPS